MTVLDFYRFLRHNALILALFTLAGLLFGAAYAMAQPTVYQAYATGIVVAGDNTSVGGAMSGNALAKQRAAVYLSIVDTSAVRSRVQAQPEIQANPQIGQGALSGEIVGESAMVRVYATGSSGENARILADAGLNALVEEALVLETLSPGEGGAEIDPSQVAVKIAKYSPATQPSSPISPNWIRILLTAAGLGLGVGLVLALITSQIDVRVRTMRDVETETGHGVLGVVPESKEFAKHREGGKISLGKLGPAGEALRQLRTNLRFVDVDNPPRSIVMTSANPGEGKSTISSLLAVLIARSGQPVVLIDADLRKPVQHKIFNADNEVGLSQVLVGDVSVDDALQPTNQPNLYVLTAGRVPANPSEMVGSRRMKSLVEALSKRYFVITDAPPVLAVTDAGLLANASDGVVLVTRVGKTQKEQLKLATKLLEQVGGRILGTVLHRARPKAMGDTVYGAGYGGKYQSYYAKGYEPAVAEDISPVEVAAPGSAAAATVPHTPAPRAASPASSASPDGAPDAIFRQPSDGAARRAD